jgi:DNA-binding response OmpR family regulator
METLHAPTKDELGEKTQTNRIKKILLIDKDNDCALSTALAEEGHDVVHCDSVHEAWNLVYPYRPHLIILRLYNADGSALSDIRECRALAEGVPIVLAITSAQISPALLKTLQHGAETVLAVSSTLESVRKALHGLERSTTKI